MKKTLLACSIAFLSCSAIAQATDHSTVRVDLATEKFQVAFEDLNLSSPTGAAVMLRRINWAAQRACGPTPSIRDMDERKEFKLCVAAATRDAVHNLGSPLVTAMYEGDDLKEEKLAAN